MGTPILTDKGIIGSLHSKQEKLQGLIVKDHWSPKDGVMQNQFHNQ
jgi:hypothetical protein